MQRTRTGIRRNKRLATVALCASILTVGTLGLAGCKSGAAAGGGGEKASGKGLVIGWSQRGISGSDWWKTLVEGGQAEAGKVGARLELLDANGDTVRQNADVQTLITKGVDVVVMNPNDPIGVGPSIQALKDAGIPVVTVNSSIDKSLVPDMFCYVAEDQEHTGSLAGKVAAQRALEKYGDKGKIKIVGIGGFPGDVLSDLRFNGFMAGWNSVMQTHPGVTTVKLDTKYGEWKPDKALGPIRDVATANPDLKVVYSMSDVMHGGIVQGLQQAGLWGDGIIMASYDGGMGAIKEMVENPNGPLQADASNQPWDQGAAAVRMAIAAVKGDQAQCPGKTKYIDTTVVTPPDASKYYVPGDTYVRAKD